MDVIGMILFATAVLIGFLGFCYISLAVNEEDENDALKNLYMDSIKKENKND